MAENLVTDAAIAAKDFGIGSGAGFAGANSGAAVAVAPDVGKTAYQVNNDLNQNGNNQDSGSNNGDDDSCDWGCGCFGTDD